MNFNEWQNFLKVKYEVEQKFLEHGINNWIEGANKGEYAGQTIEHLHYHYFDRVAGDVDDPRGGIRNFKPPLEALPDKYKFVQ